MNIVYRRLSLLLAVILLSVCGLPGFSSVLAEESVLQDAAAEAEEDPFANAIPTLPTLSLTVEYEKPTLQGELTGKATIVCNPPKSSDATVFDAPDVEVNIDLTEELALGEDCSPEFSIGTLASGESYAFPFTLQLDTDLMMEKPRDAEIEPVMTITAQSEEIGGCRYTATLDITPEAHLMLCSINSMPYALNAWIMDESANSLEEAFESLYFEGQEFSVQRFDMDISDPAAMSFDSVQAAMGAIETDENDLICLYLNAYAPSEKSGSASAFASIRDGKEAATEYSGLFAWMAEELKCRVMLLIDCETAPAAVSAASVLDPDYCCVIGVDMRAGARPEQGGGYRMQGLLAQTIFDYLEGAAPSASVQDLTAYTGGGHKADNFFKGMTGKHLANLSRGNAASPVFASDPEYHSEIWILAVKEEELEWLSPFGNEVILTVELDVFENENVISTIAVPTIHIPGRAETAEMINAQMMEFVEAERSFRDRMARETIQEDFSKHLAELSVTGCFSTGRVLSFAMSSHEYYSGAGHGIHGTAAYNYDLDSGEILSIRDMLDPREPNAEKRLVTLISNQLELHYGGMIWLTAEELTQSVFAGEMGGWEMTAGGLKVFFNEYEAGPYAIGKPEITVPYAQLKHAFHEDFLISRMLPDGQGEVVAASDPRMSEETFRQFGESQAKAFLAEGRVSQVVGVPADSYGGIFLYASDLSNACAWLPDNAGELCITWTNQDGAHAVYTTND